MIVKLSIFILQLVTQFITQTLNLSQEYQKEILMLDCKEKYWNFFRFCFLSSPVYYHWKWKGAAHVFNRLYPRQ